MQYRKNKTYSVVPRVQVEELARRLASDDAGRVQIVDVRSHGYYDSGAARIKNSIRIEPNNLEEEIKAIPKDKDILPLLHLSARSDQRPGGAHAAGKRLQHVRDRRRINRLAQGRGAAGVGAAKRSGEVADIQLVVSSSR